MAKKNNTIISDKYMGFDIKIVKKPNLNKIIISTTNNFYGEDLYNVMHHLRVLINNKMPNQFKHSIWVLLEENFGDFRNCDFTEEIINAMSKLGFCDKYLNKYNVVDRRLGDKVFFQKTKSSAPDSLRTIYTTVANISEINNKTMLKITLAKGNNNNGYNY